MESIELIDININNIEININVVNLTISKNGLTKQISKGTIIRLMGFINSWNKEYIGDDKKDKLKMVIKYNDHEDTYLLDGKYPKNYEGFKRFISSLV